MNLKVEHTAWGGQRYSRVDPEWGHPVTSRRLCLADSSDQSSVLNERVVYRAGGRSSDKPDSARHQLPRFGLADRGPHQQRFGLHQCDCRRPADPMDESGLCDLYQQWHELVAVRTLFWPGGRVYPHIQDKSHVDSDV